MKHVRFWLSICALLVIASLSFAQDPVRRLKLTIEKVDFYNNWGKFDIGAEYPYLYARVISNGKTFRTPVVNRTTAEPGWVIEIPFMGDPDRINLEIALFNDDRGLERHFNKVDISPDAVRRDLYLQYDRRQKMIAGDAVGMVEQEIDVRGDERGQRARLWLSVTELAEEY